MKYEPNWDRQKEEEIQQRFAQSLFETADKLKTQQKNQPANQSKK